MHKRAAPAVDKERALAGVQLLDECRHNVDPTVAQSEVRLLSSDPIEAANQERVEDTW